MTVTYPLHRAATTATLAVFFAFAAGLWKWRRHDVPVALTLNVVLTSLGLADVLHYRFYGRTPFHC